jgi:hypothetical protein
MLKGRNETNENRRRAGELVTLLDEPYLAFLFNYLPSPPSAPAVGAVSVVVTVACIAAVVELSLACLCSQLRYIVKPNTKMYICSISKRAHALAAVSPQRRLISRLNTPCKW